MFIQSAIRLLAKLAQFLTDIVRWMRTRVRERAMKRVLLVSLMATLLGGVASRPQGRRTTGNTPLRRRQRHWSR